MHHDFFIRTGDLVLCVDDSMPSRAHVLHYLATDRVRKGFIYTVTGIVWVRGEKGLHLAEADHRPTDGWRAVRFRKLSPAASADAFSMPATVENSAHESRARARPV